ncbi:MAG: DUF3800 domain-containing protein [Bacilli bacterium]|nr:DUF3800 domain-containing protein [Bacilli bacterium]
MEKENNWFDYPQKIKSWNHDIDYVMFIDENNSVDKQQLVYKKIINNQSINNDEKYFTITGCIFNKSGYSKMRNEIRKLKSKFWPSNGFYYDTKFKETRYVCFHSRDIRRHDGAFNDKVINHVDFTNELSLILNNVDCKIISVTIDIENFIKQNYNNNIYEIAFDFLLERYIYSTNKNKKGIIILESRGKKDDKILLNHISNVILKKGRDKISTSEFQKKVAGVYFNPKWYGGHSSTYAGLEIADLFSYPIHQLVKYKKDNPAFNIIKNKIVGYPNISGKGLKVFPKEKNDWCRS